MPTKIATAAVLLAACLSAQKPGSAEELVIKRLTNPDAAAAEAAMVELIRGGTPTVPVLERALATSKDPGFRARAERALAICAVDAPVDNGVKVGLRADRKEVESGGMVTFTATVCNVSDKPVSLFLGMSYSGNVLQNGLALQRREGDGGEQARFGRVGFCGTGAQALVEQLPPWSSKEFTMPVEYRFLPKANDVITETTPHLAMAWVFLPVDPTVNGGKVKLRLHQVIDPATAGGMVAPKSKPDWRGTLASNTIELQLRGSR